MSTPATIPIVIGITGKRDLAGKDDAVRRALSECFTTLDQAFPASRKILLTGLAAGADSIAADEALWRDRWSVIGILPLEPDTYAQDFGAAEEATFRAFLANPRVRCRTLTSLIDPTTQRPFTNEALARSDEQGNPDRADHYEQVGLFIAERCTLLIGVMEASEQPDRVGGTARVIDYRLRGMLDKSAGRVVGRSRELHKRLPLDTAETGPVWLVNLAIVDRALESPLRAVQLWKPTFKADVASNRFIAFVQSIARVFGLRSAIDPETPALVEKLQWKKIHTFIDPLRLARRIDAFNGLAVRLNNSGWPQSGTDTTDGDANSTLRRFRSTVSTIQSRNKRQLQFTVRALAILFILAVFFLELKSEFASHSSIVFYLATLLVSLLTLAWARLRRLQEYTEDYRSVAEALRVQTGWWDAGMIGRDYDVGAYFLVGATGTLALVRAATRHAIDATLLERSPPTPAHQHVKAWIDGEKGQTSYFRARIKERERTLRLVSDSIWFLFVCSLGLAASLVERVWYAMPVVPAASLLQVGAVMVIMLPLAFITSQLSKRARRRAARLVFSTLNLLPALFFGLLLANVIQRTESIQEFGLLLLSPFIDHLPNTGDVAQKLVMILAIMFATIAGASRYVIESLALEAELHNYREALGAFMRTATLGDFTNDDVFTEQQKELLFELGRFALQENESWMRAHRVRPLELMH